MPSSLPLEVQAKILTPATATGFLVISSTVFGPVFHETFATATGAIDSYNKAVANGVSAVIYVISGGGVYRWLDHYLFSAFPDFVDYVNQFFHQ